MLLKQAIISILLASGCKPVANQANNSELGSTVSNSANPNSDFYVIPLKEADQEVCFAEAKAALRLESSQPKVDMTLRIKDMSRSNPTNPMPSLRLALVEKSPFKEQIKVSIAGTGRLTGGWNNEELSIEIEPTSEAAFNELKKIYSSGTSRVKFVPGTKYSLLDFLPPSWQALVNKNFLSWPVLRGYEYPTQVDKRPLSTAPDQPFRGLGNQNCWNSSINLSWGQDGFAFIAAAQSDEHYLKNIDKLGTIVQEGASLIPGDIVMRMVILSGQSNPNYNGAGIDHTMIYVDQGIAISYDVLGSAGVFAPVMDTGIQRTLATKGEISFAYLTLRPNHKVLGIGDPSVIKLTPVRSYWEAKIGSESANKTWNACYVSKKGFSQNAPKFTPRSQVKGFPLKWNFLDSWVVHHSMHYRRYPLVFDSMGRASLSPTAYTDFFGPT